MSEVFALVFTSAGFALSVISLGIAWRFWRKTRILTEAAFAATVVRTWARFDTIDALKEWQAAVHETGSGLYSSRGVEAGEELKRLLEVHVLGISTVKGEPRP